jgi:LmbE family N-acetylglucosaminyl deacetylase
MLDHYDALYLAPHLDDAALSCGGRIAQATAAGQTALVVTVMAGDPSFSGVSDYVESLHTRWQLADDAAARRRAEDAAACAILGADYLHLTVPDCIYRRHPEGGAALYLSDDDIFGDIHPAELGLVQQISAHLAELPSCRERFVPLAVGHHVDHILVRWAAESAWGDLRYYEDYPYAQSSAAVERVLSAEEVLWRSLVYKLDAASLQRKTDAIAAFKSQLSTFFRDRADLDAQVRGFAAATGGERVWMRER